MHQLPIHENAYKYDDGASIANALLVQKACAACAAIDPVKR
jgi:hypothetical protein